MPHSKTQRVTWAPAFFFFVFLSGHIRRVFETRVILIRHRLGTANLILSDESGSGAIFLRSVRFALIN